MLVVTDTSALSRFRTTKAKISEDLSRTWFFWKETKIKRDNAYSTINSSFSFKFVVDLRQTPGYSASNLWLGTNDCNTCVNAFTSKNLCAAASPSSKTTISTNDEYQ